MANRDVSGLSGFAADLRVLGGSAVPRAVYEISKRSVGHRLLFTPTAEVGTLERVLATPLPSPDSVAGMAALADADSIIEKGCLVFGRRFALESANAWVTDPLTEQRWPTESWWTIDIRSGSRIADVKWTWEMGRHRDVVVLARAAALEPQSDVRLEALESRLRWWLAANPLESSIHWYSNLELALRLIAWTQVLGLVGDRLARDVLDDMSTHVLQIRRHLWRDLPYTLSSMRNNHLLGDALGLLIADRFVGVPTTSRTSKWAERVWDYQLARQVLADGSMIEDSLSYHRFVLEMLCVKWLLGDRSPQLREAISRSSRYLVNLGAMDGEVPQFGDWDEGRVLASSQSPHDVGNTAALGLALVGEPVDAAWIERYDLLDWFGPSEIELRAPRPERSALAVGPFARAEVGEWRVWLKGSATQSHGHADLSHVSASYRGEWVLTDPGTGTYNGPIDVRSGFRSSSAHNVLRPGGVGQREPHRAFRWAGPSGHGVVGNPLDFGGVAVLWSAHDAYLAKPVGEAVGRIARAVVVSEEGVGVIDWRESTSSTAFEYSVPLAPGVGATAHSLAIGGQELRVRLPGTVRIARGEQAPFLGWHSKTYGAWEPCDWLMAEGAQSGPLVWAIGDVSTRVEGSSVVVSGVSLSIDWSADTVSLHASRDGLDSVRVLDLKGAR